MGKTFRPYDPDQLLVLPPSLQEWLPAEHLAYFVSDVVEGLDLSAIYASYSEERGYPPYNPTMMTKLWLYGYACGVRSARKLQRASMEDVGFRVLCAGNEPDFRTLSEFRRRHLEALGGLFAQILQLCREAGLVKLGHVAIDGTKVKANASKHKAMSYERMQSEEARLKAEIERWFGEVEANDRAEDELYGVDKTGDELPEELRHRKGRLKKIAEAKAALEERARRAAQDSGEGEGDGEVKPDPKAQRNFTDPQSRIMRSSDGAFIQGYNCQLAVDAEKQVIVAADVVQEANDVRELIPMVEASVDAFQEVPKAFSADAGYFSQDNAETLQDYEIEAYVAPEKIGHRQWREAKSPRGRIPNGLTEKERMRRKLETKKGRAEYDKRKITVEPVCGQLKTVQGMRQFHQRGLEKVTGEWLLACTSHNLLKLFRNRDRTVATAFGARKRTSMGLAVG